MAQLAALVLVVMAMMVGSRAQDLNQFPDGFMFGLATSAHQIEGAWNLSGKGENIWDRFTHSRPEMIADGSNADIATDSYNKYPEDVRLLKEMNMNTYRFSIAWSRIFPFGFSDEVNQEGIDYYNRVIDLLLENGITPLVTMYHWDLPQPLQELFGGWTNESIITIYEQYARLLFASFGDRVKWWITFNEPVETCRGYTNGATAPGIVSEGINDYIVGHTILKAHARVYHIYDEEFRPTQQGKVSITLNSDWSEPATNSTEDLAASDRGMQFYLGWFAHPIYSAEGDYPSVMKERIAANSAAGGFPQSRLPEFDAFWVDHIRGTWDFFGLNHYTSVIVTPGEEGPDPSRYRDSGILNRQDPSWPGSNSNWLKVVPWGMRKILNWIAVEYNNPPVVVTENGYIDFGQLDDTERIDYYLGYMSELLKAVHLDGNNVIGYMAWSLLDNFEWSNGYTQKFGFYQTNFTDPARPRVAKDSSFVMREIAGTGRLPTNRHRE